MPEKKVVLFLHDGVLSGGFTSDPDIKVVVSVFETDLDSKEGEDAFWTKCNRWCLILECALSNVQPDCIGSMRPIRTVLESSVA